VINLANPSPLSLLSRQVKALHHMNDMSTEQTKKTVLQKTTLLLQWQRCWHNQVSNSEDT
jgi:hypothetical protein